MIVRGSFTSTVASVGETEEAWVLAIVVRQFDDMKFC